MELYSYAESAVATVLINLFPVLVLRLPQSAECIWREGVSNGQNVSLNVSGNMLSVGTADSWNFGTNLEGPTPWGGLLDADTQPRECFDKQNVSADLLSCEYLPPPYCVGKSISCRDRCDELPVLFNECSCQSSCLLYKRCCEDFEEACPSQHAAAVNVLVTFGGVTARCDSVVNAMLISTCPVGYWQHSVRERCENPNLHTSQGLYPVTDSLTQHHFRNQDCWNCWSMTGVPLSWMANVSVKLFDVPEDQYSANFITTWIVENPRLSQWSPPDGVIAHFCDSCAVSTCTDCYDSALEFKCSNSLLYVEVDEKPFNNQYCYQCSKDYSDHLDARNLPECKVLEQPYHQLRVNFEFDYTDLEFNVIVRFREDAFVLEQEMNWFYESFMWKELVCSYQNPSCIAQSCRDQTHVEIEGRCDYVIRTAIISFCIDTDYYPPTECKNPGTFEETFGFSKHLLLEQLRDNIEKDLPRRMSPYLCEINRTVEVGPASLLVEYVTNWNLPLYIETGAFQIYGIHILEERNMLCNVTHRTYVCTDSILGKVEPTVNSIKYANCFVLFPSTQCRAGHFTLRFTVLAVILATPYILTSES